MAANWIVNSRTISAILYALFTQGCASGFVDSYVKGATEGVLGKDYISSPESAAALGQYAKTLEICKEYLSPQQFGLYTSDISWYVNYIDNALEQEAYTKAFNTTEPKKDECQKISYDAEAIHNIRLDQQRESVEAQKNRRTSQTNCVERNGGVSCTTSE